MNVPLTSELVKVWCASSAPHHIRDPILEDQAACLSRLNVQQQLKERGERELSKGEELRAGISRVTEYYEGK